jgi:hypothetical protein
MREVAKNGFVLSVFFVVFSFRASQFGVFTIVQSEEENQEPIKGA